MSLSARIVGNGVMPPCHVGSRELDVSSVMALTSWNTTESSVGAVKLTIKLTHQDSKPREANLALICSSAPIVKEIIKPTPFNVHFGDIVSTVSGISESILRSVKTGQNRSVPV